MITICHLSTSRSERIIWLMEELGLPYELEGYRREKNGAAPASMREIHALGRAPIIRDGELVLAESGAIVEYIVQRHAGGRLGVAPSAPNFARYIYWMHFAEGSLMSLMLIALTLSRIPEADANPRKKVIYSRVAHMVKFVDDEIAKTPWFAGPEFTAADIMMAFPFSTMRHYLEFDLAPYTNILAYLQRIEQRPAFRKAMALV